MECPLGVPTRAQLLRYHPTTDTEEILACWQNSNELRMKSWLH